jgi:two-component system alkaline phosphatase synthesis response regulator PhoP
VRGNREGSTGRKRILVVDDDEMLLTLMRILLSEHYDVDTAPNGATALKKAETSPPDLILLDLRMPGVDGRSVYRELQSRNIPSKVMIVSAYGAEQAKNELGAQGHVTKPFSPDVLITAVQRLLT